MKRKSIEEVVENPRDNEYYVLVTRHYPKKLRFEGMSMGDEKNPIDIWDRDLAPTKSLLRDWKSDKIIWDEYRERFISECPTILIDKKTEIYQEAADKKEVVLVCLEGAEDYPYCHTWIILEVEEVDDGE